jgi:hypothetical protein
MLGQSQVYCWESFLVVDVPSMLDLHHYGGSFSQGLARVLNHRPLLRFLNYRTVLRPELIDRCILEEILVFGLLLRYSFFSKIRYIFCHTRLVGNGDILLHLHLKLSWLRPLLRFIAIYLVWSNLFYYCQDWLLCHYFVASRRPNFLL